MITRDERAELRGWFTGRLPAGLFEELVAVTADREEITVVGRIPGPGVAPGASAAEREAAREGRVAEFRRRTRRERMSVAREAERRFGRKVSWGVECGGERTLFTHVAAPVMTRLRQPEREVLDTLIASGVVRSRSEALAWCVRLVSRHTDDWLSELRESLAHVERVRARGPDLGADFAADSDADPDAAAEADEQADAEAGETPAPRPAKGRTPRAATTGASPRQRREPR